MVQFGTDWYRQNKASNRWFLTQTKKESLKSIQNEIMMKNIDLKYGKTTKKITGNSAKDERIYYGISAKKRFNEIYYDISMKEI